MLKILQINAINKYGSTGRNVYEIAEYLKEQGEECIVACSIPTGSENEYVIGSRFDHKVHALLSRVFGKQACFSKGTTKQLVSYMEKEKFDVVHINNVHSNYLHMPTLFDYLAKQRIPTVVTLHDCWFYTGHCFHYTRIACEKWQTGCSHCPKIREGNSSWFFDTSAYMWNLKKELLASIPKLAVVGVSEWITKEARKSFLGNAFCVERIYNWVDLEQFRIRTEQEKQETKRKFAIQENTFIILGVASEWDEYKGINDFRELAELLPKDMQIVLVGRMPKQIPKSPKITYLPQTADVEELAKLYAMADVFLNLSLEESFGKVSAEALACGTPVVCVNCTANPELVGKNCGIVVEKPEKELILEALEKIRSHDESYRERDCRAFAEENFSKEKRIRDYLRLYQKLV